MNDRKIANAMLCFAVIVLMAVPGLIVGCSGDSPDARLQGDAKPSDRADGGDSADSTAHSAKTVSGGHNATDTGTDQAGGADSSATRKRTPRFENWENPQLVFLLTGRQHGYIEPCGCTGLANQKGGLARRQTLFREFEKKGWSIVALDVGNQVRRPGRQAVIKFQRTADALQQMKYAAVGFGPDDLRLSVDEIAAQTISSDEQPRPFVCANVAIYGPEFTPQYRVVEAGGKRIGVTAVLGAEHLKQVMNEFIVSKPVEEGLREAWSKLKDEKCDLLVLLAHTSMEETRELARKFADFDIIVAPGGGAVPPLAPEKVDGSKAMIVELVEKGMYVGVVGVFDDAEKPLDYDFATLDSSYADSQDMLDLLKAYQDQLKEIGFEGLGLRPIPHVSGWKYVGSERCQGCHEDEYNIWRHGQDGKGDDGSHFVATHSLVHPNERGDIPRHFDPECLSCHVTGWNPQRYFPYATGYLDLEASKHLHGNGCENCHGPGSQHVAVYEGEIDVDADTEARINEAMRVTLEQAGNVAHERSCYKCHDLDNSPDFQVKGAFERYWEKIKHGAK